MPSPFPVAGSAGNLAPGDYYQPTILYAQDGTPLLTANGMKVDTELPAARLAADNLALPTAPDVLAVMMGYDGSTLDMLRAPFGILNIASISGNAAADGNSAGGFYSRQPDGSSLGLPGVSPFLWNNVGWDKQRSNFEAVALASASRATTTNSADLTNHNAHGIIALLDITATPNNAETLTLAIQAKDSISGKYLPLTAFATILASGLGALPVTATFGYTLYPGTAETAAVGNHEVQSLVLSRTWRVQVIHSAGGSWTYSVSYALVN